MLSHDPRLPQALRQYLEHWRDAGVTHLPRAAAPLGDMPLGDAPIADTPNADAPLAEVQVGASSPEERATIPLEQAQTRVEEPLPPLAAPPPAEPPPVAPRAPIVPAAPVGASPPAAASGRSELALAELRLEVAACTRCPALVRNRRQTVFGVGDPRPRLCFFGEAPGEDEDKQGEPFVGRSGQLLNDILTKGMGLRRQDVYILNVLKCRPPNNRQPSEEECANCRPFWQRQLEILRPEYICCLGAVAARNLLETTKSIGLLRGSFHAYQNAKVVVTYHPSYLLRYPDEKRKTWEDIKMLLADMGLAPPGARKD